MYPETSRSSWTESGARPLSTAKDLGRTHETGYRGEISTIQCPLQFASTPMHEEDAGPVLDRLPPVYDPRWGDSM